MAACLKKTSGPSVEPGCSCRLFVPLPRPPTLRQFLWGVPDDQRPRFTRTLQIALEVLDGGSPTARNGETAPRLAVLPALLRRGSPPREYQIKLCHVVCGRYWSPEGSPSQRSYQDWRASSQLGHRLLAKLTLIRPVVGDAPPQQQHSGFDLPLEGTCGH
jgi:hypothetical protein